MEENNAYELLDVALEEGYKDLKKLEAGSEQHSRQVSDIVKLHEVKLKADKLNDERNESLYRRGFESEKLEYERKLKIAEIKNIGKQILVTTVREFGIPVLYVFANRCNLLSIMNFQTHDTLNNRELNMLHKFNMVK